MAVVEVKVPDIGDFKDVEVIEVLVKAGDQIAVDQSLVTSGRSSSSRACAARGIAACRAASCSGWRGFRLRAASPHPAYRRATGARACSNHCAVAARFAECAQAGA